MRRLLILPIVHSRSDLGSLQAVANQAKVAALGERRAESVAKTVDEFWIAVKQALTSIKLDFARVSIYQDGLPLVPNVALQLEKKIVDDLARSGSPNHQLVQWMMSQGAALVGTESPELLVQEYHAIRRNLTEGYHAEDAAESSGKSTGSTLLAQRDRFIAARIDQTLGNEQVGLLFIGMLHQVESYLPEDVEVEYPVGRPPSHVLAV